MLLIITCALSLLAVYHPSTSLLQQAGTEQEARREPASTQPLSDGAKFIARSLNEVHCYPTSSRMYFAPIDFRACHWVIDWLRMDSRRVGLYKDHKKTYHFTGFNCKIEIIGGSRDITVKQLALADVATSIIHDHCREPGRGGVASFGDDEYFLSIYSEPRPWLSMGSMAAGNNVTMATAVDISKRGGPDLIDTIQCYDIAGYVQVNLRACIGVLQAMRRLPQVATYRPGARAHWGNPSCSVWLLEGSQSAEIWSVDVARLARTILSVCNRERLGGVGLLGVGGFHVAIRADPPSFQTPRGGNDPMHVKSSENMAPPTAKTLARHVGSPFTIPYVLCYGPGHLRLDDNDCINTFARLQHMDADVPLRRPGAVIPYQFGVGTCRAAVRPLEFGIEMQFREVGRHVEDILKYCSVYTGRSGTGGEKKMKGYSVEVYRARMYYSGRGIPINGSSA